MSTDVVESLKRQLAEVNEVMMILGNLVQIQEGLQCIAGANNTHNFSQAADAILSIHNLLSGLVGSYQDVRILHALQVEFCVQKEAFLFDIGEKWKQLVSWGVPDSSEQRQELKVMSDTNSVEILKDVVVVMEKLDILDAKVKVFGEQLIVKLIEPCVRHCDTSVEEKGQPTSLSVTCSNDGKPPSPSDAANKLLKILDWLNNHLLNMRTDSEEGGEILMEQVGSVIAHRVLDLVVKQCLAHAIPTSNKQMADFQNDISLIEYLNKRLVEIRFLPPHETALTDFVQNVNVLFANKKCQEILVKARNLMTSEMHNTVPVSDDKPLGELPPLETGPSGKKTRKLDLAGEYKLSDSTFRLPACHIR